MRPGPISIALVDDSPQLRKFLRSFLPMQGFEIACEAANGQELFSILENTGKAPALCLVDINMPVMDGYATTTELKRLYPSVRVLAYSFYDDKKRIAKIMDCGAYGFICKDASTDELIDALTSIYNLRDIPYGVGELELAIAS